MEPLPPYDARVVANHLLGLAKREGRQLTQLSLLKLVYYAHGWHHAYFGGPLVADRFEAWEYGPVVRSVRDAFADFGRRPITRYAQRFDFILGREVPLGDQVSAPVKSLLAWTLATYGQQSAWALSEATHENGSPWHQVWNAQDGRANVGLVIPDEKIAKHFAHVYSEAGRN